MSGENVTRKEISLEDLALMIAKRFDELDEKIDGVEIGLKSEMLKVKTGLQSDISRVEKKMDAIEANLNKKVDKIDHNTLTYRVEKWEKKFA